MKVLILGFLLSMSVAGCSEDDKKPTAAPVQEQGTQEERRITEIKMQLRLILATATERFDVDDGLPEISAKIEPYVRELQSLQPERTLDETKALLVGSWHQLWSNIAVGDPGRGPLADFVYQVILADGDLWNIALVENGPNRRTELLRAQYIVSNDTFDFTYSKAVFISQWLNVGTHLNLIAADAEKGRYDVNRIVYEEGKSPLGLKATMQDIYI